MTGFCVGTMSTENGWEMQSVPQAVSLHLTYWFASRRNQAKTMDQVPSFYYLWQKYGTNQEQMVQQCRTELKAYMMELFEVVNVEVTAVDSSEGGSTYRLVFAVQVFSDGTPYDLARSVIITNEMYKVLDEERLNDAR